MSKMSDGTFKKNKKKKMSVLLRMVVVVPVAFLLT